MANFPSRYESNDPRMHHTARETYCKSISTLRIATIALGMSYISTSYMPMEDNQFLHASAPVRVLLRLAGRPQVVNDQQGECEVV
ncbi:hypothetical protein BT96DRAFT_924240 [Gymnopus androsaceus JB14]|uniref:Uncharacterized protein n=1 Tax=Gymnopus androsaceus JB14 TaxID=1447944 RepID=A0A6A4H5Y1_9AGAR|nr:hypothetical protein BT96DRAFT_924240 [Gymnopus androsaceus JB14]